MTEKDRLLEKLGLPSTATLDDVKRAYRGIARKIHPDVVPITEKTPEGQERERKFILGRMQELNAVRDRLLALWDDAARVDAPGYSGVRTGKSAFGEWEFDESVGATFDPDDPWGDSAEVEDLTEVAEGEDLAGDYDGVGDEATDYDDEEDEDDDFEQELGEGLYGYDGDDTFGDTEGRSWS